MRYVARQFRMGKPDLQEGVETRRHGDNDEDFDMERTKKEKKKKKRKKELGE